MSELDGEVTVLLVENAASRKDMRAACRVSPQLTTAAMFARVRIHELYAAQTTLSRTRTASLLALCASCYHAPTRTSAHGGLDWYDSIAVVGSYVRFI